MASNVFRRYYWLSKPGIVYANVLTAVAGYFYASMWHIDFVVLVGLVIGVALLIAGACAYNNYLDRDIDMVMTRTKERGLVAGTISGRHALIFATLAASSGTALLAFTQNRITLLLTIIAFVDYVVLYGVGKRTTVHGTLVGSISGSIPVMAGYTAVTNTVDLQAWLLFALMVMWQMAHFYAIALYRLDDYRMAKIPVMPVVYGPSTTKLQTVIYIALFIAMTLGLAVFGDLGVLAGTVLTAAGLWWLAQSLASYWSLQPVAWGKQVFFTSLTVVMVLSAALAVGPALF